MIGPTIHRGVVIVHPDVPDGPFSWVHDASDHHDSADTLKSAVDQVDAYLDDLAVDRFAVAMKAKLAAKRAEGYGGWDDPAVCTAQRLANLLIGAVGKGDPVDVGNFAMMLHERGARTHG